MVGFSGLDDKTNPPLQAADLMADHSLEIGVDWPDNGNPPAKESELQPSIGFLAVWSEPDARSFLHHELKRKCLPIPEDLERDHSQILEN